MSEVCARARARACVERGLPRCELRQWGPRHPKIGQQEPGVKRAQAQAPTLPRLKCQGNACDRV